MNVNLTSFLSAMRAVLSKLPLWARLTLMSLLAAGGILWFSLSGAGCKLLEGHTRGNFEFQTQSGTSSQDSSSSQTSNSDKQSSTESKGSSEPSDKPAD